MAFIPDDPKGKGFIPQGPGDHVLKPEEPSAAAVAGRRVVGSALPTATGVAGAGAGEEVGGPIGGLIGEAIGARFGPEGAAAGYAIGQTGGRLIGGIGGGLLGSSAGEAAQGTVFHYAPALADALGQSPDQMAADRAAHPWAYAAGEIVPQLATFRPSLDILKLGTEEGNTALRGAFANAAIAGGTNVGQQYLTTGQVDWGQAGEQAALGGLLTKPWLAGEPLLNLGRGAGRMGRTPPAPGTPDIGGGPDAAPGSDTSPLTQGDLLNAAKMYGGAITGEDNLPIHPGYAADIYQGGAQLPDTRANLNARLPTGGQQELFPGANLGTAPARPEAQAPTYDVGMPSPDANVTGGLMDNYRSLIMDLRAANKNPDGTLRSPDAYTLRLGNQLHDHLMNGDAGAAIDFLNGEQQKLEAADIKPETLRQRQNTIDAAREAVIRRLGYAGKEQALDLSAGPAGPDDSNSTTVDDMRAANLEADRTERLNKVLSNPDNNAPALAFTRDLAANGHTDLTIRPDEAEQIQRFMQERGSPDEGGTYGIPEAPARDVAPKAQAEPARAAPAQDAAAPTAESDAGRSASLAEFYTDAAHEAAQRYPSGERALMKSFLEGAQEAAGLRRERTPEELKGMNKYRREAYEKGREYGEKARPDELATAEPRPEPKPQEATPEAAPEPLPHEYAAQEYLADKGYGPTIKEHFMRGVQHEHGGGGPIAEMGSTVREHFEKGRQWFRDMQERAAAPVEEGPKLGEFPPVEGVEGSGPYEPPPAVRKAYDTAYDVFSGMRDKGLLTDSQLNQLNHMLEEGKTRRIPPTEHKANIEGIRDVATQMAEGGDTAQRSSAQSMGGMPARGVRPVELNWPHTRAYLEDRLNRMGLGQHVQLKILNYLRTFSAEGEERPFAGAYYRMSKIIRLSALAHDPDLGHLTWEETLDHEAMHALHALGFFKPHEWQAMLRYAKQDRDVVRWVKENYKGQSKGVKDQELVAEAFAQWRTRQRVAETGMTIDHDLQGPRGFWQRIHDRLKDFFSAIYDTIRKTFPDEGAKLFKAIHEGEMINRDPDPSQAIWAMDDSAHRAMPTDPMKRTARDLMEDSKSPVRKAALWLSSMRQIGDRYKDLPAIQHIVDTLAVTGAKRESYMAVDKPIWETLRDLPEDAPVHQLLLDGSAQKTDASKPDSPLNAQFKALPKDQQDAYKKTLESAQTKVKNFLALMEAQGVDTAALKNKLGNEGYFPFLRFGDYITIAKTPEYAKAEAAGDTEAMDKLRDEHYAVFAHERASDQQKAIAALKEQGYETSTHKRAQYFSRMEGVGATFLSKFDDKLAHLTTVHPDLATAFDSVRTMAHDLAFSMMPDGSQLAGKMRRKGVAGFSTDVPRVFAAASRRDAMYLSSIEQAMEMSKHIAEMRKQASGRNDLEDVANHVVDHLNSLSKVVNTPVQNFLNSMTYAYMLGGSPSFMVMHVMQTPMITAPWLSGHFAPGRVSSELGAAGSHVISGGLKKLADGQEHLTGRTADEQNMLKYLVSRGLISTTQARDMQQAAKGEGVLGQIGEKIMHFAGMAPHYTEKFNRVVTALAAYKMALDKPSVNMSAEDHAAFMARTPEGITLTPKQLAAARFAEQCIAETHVDYSRENAPKIMQPGVMPLGKLVFQFQKYQQGMTHMLLSNVHDMLKGETPEVRRAAFRTLIGVLATHALTTGMMGLPLVGTAAFLSNMYNKFLGDHDKPHDAENEYRRFMTSTFGPTMGEMLLRGVLYTPGIRDLFPGDVTDRLGLGDMLNPGTVDKIDRDSAAQYMGAMLGGPAGSLLAQFADAYDKGRHGETWKAVEDLMPKALRDVSKTVRYQVEGVTTGSHNPVVDKSEITPMMLAAQFMGFQPQLVQQDYANRNAVQTAVAQLDDRRSVLLKRLTDARMSGDGQAISDAMAAINKFNDARSQDGLFMKRITGNEMTRSFMNRRMNQTWLNDGVSLKPRDRRQMQYAVEGGDDQ